MIKKKKLDIFNLFYSGAAVVILIGVIAKLLEWPMQDLLITGGLAIEAVVFGVSAFKYIDVENELKNDYFILTNGDENSLTIGMRKQVLFIRLILLKNY